MRARSAKWAGLWVGVLLAACGGDAPKHAAHPLRQNPIILDMPGMDAGPEAIMDARSGIAIDRMPDANGGGTLARSDSDAEPAPVQPAPAGLAVPDMLTGPAAGNGAAAAPPPPPPLTLDAGLPFAREVDDAGDDDDAGLRPPRLSDCSNKLGAPGNTTRMANGRSFIVHIPPNAAANHPLPVMFAFHGAGGKGSDMQVGTGFDTLADLQPVVMVYPDGAPGQAPWNVGRNVCPPGNFVSTTNDDDAYVEAMLDDIERDQCIDRGRVFATGFSMGGYFSNELGCRLGGQRVRAIAPHSGGAHAGSCAGPVPVLLLHGDADSLINYRCGTQARDYWIQRNGCSQDFDTFVVTGGECSFARACSSGAPVGMCSFKGLEHAWAFPPMYEHSSLLIWAFFSAYF